MPKTDDAYGHVLVAILAGRNAREIVEREDGFIQSGTSSKYFSLFEDWGEHEREAMKYVSGRVLDIGCGAGRHALYVQEMGHRVLGIDSSALAIKVCRERGLRACRCLSAGTVSRQLGTFDTILMLGNNFGIMGSAERTQWLLRRLHSSTSPPARIIAETLDPHKTKEAVHRSYHRDNEKKGRLPGQVRMRVRYDALATRWFDYLFVSKTEMRKIVKGTGWKITKTLDAQGASYIAILEKANE